MNTLDNRTRGKAPAGGTLGKHSGLLATLIKKQFMELATLFSFGKKRSKSGSAGGFVITLAIYVILGLSIGAGVSTLADEMGFELLGKGEDWKFFILMDIMGVLLGTLITMFTADLTLFRAKDNEMLLSMPIPPGYILLARMMPLCFISFIFVASTVIPTMMTYSKIIGFSAFTLISNIIMLIALTFLALGLSAVLGWLVSLVNARLKGKGIASTIASLLFLGAYFFVYFQMSKFTSALISHSSAMADWIHKFLPPLYFVGLGHTGSPIGLVLGLLTIAVIFGVIYFALSRTFRNAVISAGKGGSSKVGSGVLKAGSQAQVLLFKEYRRFISSSSYMMNCGLGAIFMVAFAVAAVIKRNSIVEILDSAKEVFPNASGIAPAVLTIVIFAIVSTCYYTMPSISLEGKNIWILQTMPIDPMKIFMAKIKMEYILCVPAALILATTVAIITGMSVLTWAAVMIATIAYTTFTAFFGLWINMKRPSFDWTNEAYPIKQGLNPLICLFGEWVLTLIFAGIFFVVGMFIPCEIYLLIVSVVLLLISFVIYRWLAGPGRRKFAYLG